MESGSVSSFLITIMFVPQVVHASRCGRHTRDKFYIPVYQLTGECAGPTFSVYNKVRFPMMITNISRLLFQCLTAEHQVA